MMNTERHIELPRTPIDVLMAEDNPDDVFLTQESLRESKLLITLHVVPDGVEAVAFLKKTGKYAEAPRPSVILLDLNMPRKNGYEVLEEIKSDEALKSIPVVVLTTSQSESDVVRSYQLHANCYVVKPVNLEKFEQVVQTIERFWLTIVELPR